MTNTRAANEALNANNASLEVQVKPLSEVVTPSILDMCCGSRMFWFKKNRLVTLSNIGNLQKSSRVTVIFD